MRNTESMGSRGRGGLPQRPRALPTPILLCGYGTAPWALPERTSKCSLEAWSPNSLQGPEPRNWGPLILSHLHQPAALVKNDGTKAGPTASLRLLGGWVEYDPPYREEREVTFSVCFPASCSRVRRQRGFSRVTAAFSPFNSTPEDCSGLFRYLKSCLIKKQFILFFEIQKTRDSQGSGRFPLNIKDQIEWAT